MRLTASIGETNYELKIERRESGWRCRVDGRETPIDVAQTAPNRLSILIKGKSYDVIRGAEGAVAVGERWYEVAVADPRSWRTRKQAAAGTSGPQKLKASMPGKVVRVLASAGRRISAGQGLVVIEAMKMQNEVRSPREGTVTAILVKEGANVNAGDVVAIVE